MKEKNAKNWLNSTVIGASITSFLSDTSHEIVTVFLPSFLIALNAPVYALGLIEGVSDGISSFVKLFSGYYADKLNRRKEFSTVGYIATALFPLVLAVAASWPVVLAGRAFGWLGRGIRGPPRDAILAGSVKKKDLGKAFGIHRAGDTLGAIAGPLVAVYLVSSMQIPLREIFLLSVVPGILAVAAFWFLVKEKKNGEPHGSKSFMLSIKQMPRRFNLFVAAVLSFGIADFSHTLLIFFAVTQLAPSMGLEGATAAGAALYLVRNASYALLSYPFGALGDRFGRRNTLAFGYGIAVLTFIGFIFAPADLLAYGVLFALAGAFIAAEDSLEGAVTGELLGDRKRGLGYGIISTANGIGDFASSIIVSALWSAFGFASGFAFAAVVGLVGTLALVWASSLDEKAASNTAGDS